MTCKSYVLVNRHADSKQASTGALGIPRDINIYLEREREERAIYTLAMMTFLV
jgi:hypothetical protein